jgi:hypothetical protein
VQVHSDDMAAPRGLQHVRDQLSTDGRTAFVLLVLARVGKIGNDGGDAAGRRGLARVDQDQQLHQAVIDLAGRGALDDEHILVTHTLGNRNRDFLVGRLAQLQLCELDAEAVEGMESAAFVAKWDETRRPKKKKKKVKK